MANHNNEIKPIFMSYRRTWQDEVRELANSLHLRGLRVFLDYSDPASFVGVSMYEEMRRVIQQECSAMLLHVTRDIVDSAAIWKVEIPAARKRAGDGRFFILPFFRGMSPKEFSACHAQGASLAASNGVNAVPSVGTDLESFLAGKRAEVAGLLLDRLVKANITGSISLAMWTRPTAALSRDADLLLDWCSVYPDTVGPAARCADAQTAIRQLAVAFAKASIRELHVDAKSHLSAAVLFGSEFTCTAGFHLFLKQGPTIWSSRGPLDASQPRVARQQLDPDKEDIVLIVSVSRTETVSSVERALPKLGIVPAGQVVVTPEAGESRESIPSEACARRFAKSAASALMNARSDWGARPVHLFISSPVALAMLIGHQLNRLGPIHIYEHYDRTDSYHKAFTV